MLRYLILLLFVSQNLWAVCGLIKTRVEAEGANGQTVTLDEGQIVHVKSKNNARNAYNVMVNGVKLLVPKIAMQLVKGAKCEGEPAQAGAGVPQKSQPVQASSISSVRWLEKWRLGIELGMLSGMSNSIYDGLVTSVPNSGNVGQLQDPIITSVDKGSGYILRVYGERPVYKLVHAGVGLGYRQESYKYNYKNNPSLAAVTLDSLSGGSKDISIKRIQLDAVVGMKHQIDDFTVGYGLQIALVKNQSGKQTVNVLVPSGAFFKNTAATVEGGPKDLEFETWLRLDGRWKKNLGVFLEIGADGGFMYGLGYSF